ncbi:MAG: DnaJ domain-containing protein [Phycisphaerae bacterium]|jgi:DnaJ-class molecular chaperone|nr:DnaJ domain-containing protein [Phycisphaerae bacterium]
MGDKDYYKILGLARDASQEEIKRAYRRLVKQFHPDTNRDPNAASRFCDIDEAHDVLVDPELRREYDLRTGQPAPDAIPRIHHADYSGEIRQHLGGSHGVSASELAASQFESGHAAQGGGKAVRGWRQRGKRRRRREKIKFVLGCAMLTIAATFGFFFAPCWALPILIMLAVALFIPRLRD